MPLGSIARKESTSVSASGFGAVPCASVSSRAPASEKLTMRAPPPVRTSRLEAWMFMTAPPSRTRRAHDGFDNAGMSPAAAEIVGERIFDLRRGRLLGRGQERGRLHDHAVDAVAALHRLLLYEGALHGMELACGAEPFERDHLLLGGERGQRRDA